MLDVLRGDTIRGVVFSNYNEFGYQNLYSFPPPIENLDVHLPIDKSIFKQWQQERDQFFSKPNVTIESPPTKRFGGLQDIALYTDRDFLQIAVKSISLLIGEKVLEKDPSLVNMKFYGILPYPDLHVYSYTFFRFYSVKGQNIPRGCTFSLLIDKTKKNFIYDNHDFLNELIQNTVESLIIYLEKGEWNSDKIPKNTIGDIQTIILNFFNKLLPISGHYSHPVPLDEHRSKKIVFTGLKNSGKNSFLLTLNRKYSKLIDKRDYQKGNIHMTKILGTTVLNWEPDPTFSFPDLIKSHAEIYLDDADLLYFFIDGSNLRSIDESKDFFIHIIQNLEENNISIPIVIIISKIDNEIKHSQTIQQNISLIKSIFTPLASPLSNVILFFETSIFSISSCLTAFSNGTTILMQNGNKIRNILKNYAVSQNLPSLMLINEYGLTFSSYINPSIDIPIYMNQQSIEMLALQLINIFKKLDSNMFLEEFSTIHIQLRENLYGILIKIQSLEPFYIFFSSTSKFESKDDEFLKNMVKELTETLVS